PWQPRGVFVMAPFLKMFRVECPVCYQEYDQDSKLPRMLECLHVFCTECLRKIQLTPLHPPDPNSAPSISCPLCRHSTPLQGGTAYSLPCNSRILAQLPPVAFRLPASVTARLATVTQRLVLSLGERDTRFIILPTVIAHPPPNPQKFQNILQHTKFRFINYATDICSKKNAGLKTTQFGLFLAEGLGK
uniref:Si:ch73-335l21.2 n=1 Tax=Sinocyclocheilus rhinocerous TaxID=307959 RepID=A0A673HK71_9TELE